MNDDHPHETDVLAELTGEPSISADHIGVTAKHAAEMAAGRVKGLKAIAEQIEVQLPLHIKHGDDEIAAALNRLMWEMSVPRDTVNVWTARGTASVSNDFTVA